ncbi:MAG: hypothetical protein JNL57_01535 [Bacteroidetes bacterium]|nr:hypothetical protein [Bacteroidota bacterium]
MKKRTGFIKLLPVFMAIIAVNPVGAQQSGLIIGAGVTNFLGDLGGKPGLGTNDPSDMNVRSLRYALTLGYRQHLTHWLALRGNVYYARLSADDKYTQNLERRTRNLSFFSPLVQGMGVLEIYPGHGRRTYLFAGAGMFYFNPKTRMNGNVYTLRDYGTEGQYFMPGKSPYKQWAFSMPFGFGHRIASFRNGGVLNAELTMHKTTTDYMDDVSTTYVDKTQLAASNGTTAVALSDRSLPGIPSFSEPGNIRGNPRSNDNFAFLTFTYTQPLGAKSVGQGFGGRSKYGMKRRRDFCPNRF